MCRYECIVCPGYFVCLCENANNVPDPVTCDSYDEKTHVCKKKKVHLSYLDPSNTEHGFRIDPEIRFEICRDCDQLDKCKRSAMRHFAKNWNQEKLPTGLRNNDWVCEDLQDTCIARVTGDVWPFADTTKRWDRVYSSVPERRNSFPSIIKPVD